MTKDVGFMELIQIHERRWGTNQYAGRPTLQQLMEWPIVAVWGQAKGFTLSAHQTGEELNRAVTALFVGGAINDVRRLVRVFYKRKPLNYALKVIKVSEPKAGSQPTRPNYESNPAGLSKRKQILIDRHLHIDQKPPEKPISGFRKFMKKLGDDGR